MPCVVGRAPVIFRAVIAWPVNVRMALSSVRLALRAHSAVSWLPPPDTKTGTGAEGVGGRLGTKATLFGMSRRRTSVYSCSPIWPPDRGQIE